MILLPTKSHCLAVANPVVTEFVSAPIPNLGWVFRNITDFNFSQFFNPTNPSETVLTDSDGAFIVIGFHRLILSLHTGAVDHERNPLFRTGRCEIHSQRKSRDCFILLLFED